LMPDFPRTFATNSSPEPYIVSMRTRSLSLRIALRSTKSLRNFTYSEGKSLIFTFFDFSISSSRYFRLWSNRSTALVMDLSAAPPQGVLIFNPLN